MNRYLPVYLMLFFSSLAMAAGKKVPLEAFVSTEKAFIWSQPGYSWADCRPLEPNEPENKFKSKQDESLTMRRFNSGAKTVCNTRDKKLDLLSAGDAVEIAVRENGKVISEEHEIIIGGELMKKTFYMVNYKGRIGWMSEDQVTEPQPRETLRAQTSKSNPYCPPGSKAANQLRGLAIQIPELQNAIDRKLALGSPKTDREIDRYMCLYHDGHIKNDNFPAFYKKFQKSAKQASQSFGVPYGLIMCTMLVESGLYYNPNERKEYKGLPQFGSALVADLNKVKNRPPYNSMWEKFHQMNPHSDLSDSSVRSSADPTSPAAAIALAYQWIYWERIKQNPCKDCSIGTKLNRKDLYMMVTGYNWGPYSLGKVAGKTAFEMRNNPPPPKESRDYMARMENCLEGGYDQSFRDESRKKPAKPKSRTAASILESFKGSASAERKVYEDRVEQCDRQFPVK